MQYATPGQGPDDTTPRALVLAIDDDARILRMMKMVLSQAGYRVEVADGGESGLRAAAEHHPDIVLLDLLLPGMTGFEILTALKESEPDRPVVICSVSTKEPAKLQALELGADDFVAKPFGLDDLVSRIRFLLTTPGEGAERSHLVRLDGLEIDTHHQTVTRDGQLIPLSKTEWQLLAVLVSHDGAAALFSDLLAKVWGPTYRDDVAYLRVWIARLRKKLDADTGEHAIIDFHGVGYRLNLGLKTVEAEEAAAV